ncbi:MULTISPECIES: YbaB/EbfC family nucleoid-associated protein [Actinopolyspora]|uniref:YbaB/EbfC DNA-binding family protein n=1 Tax=Actinopolyspora saharensis TaxID=995062 RepID=A0A1H1EBB8_9ACTN|nr:MULTISPECIES: YbaB/EbfC family nucleoid-associated protein [Actinopolyspora]NHD19009.1 YbaB/EbfC family nucleoid-associated protein [Actinopolyspora sp. BKK2]NHE78206.1 YbaB/EbfC family nucleoid-associated protein [Actinopolyspora sp. BKK1]SDQ85840.1 YbaB/EbfC DNA-binding family protein [Actinopolyspora saharensis]
MTTPSDPDGMLAGFHKQIEEKMQQAERIREAATAVRAESSNRDGSVRVTVDQNGNMSDLELTDGALRRRPDELSSEIMSTVRSAQTQLAERMREAMEPVLGSDTETLGSVLSGVRDRFPADPEEPAEQGSTSNRSGAPDDSGEEDFDEFDWMNSRRR